jgi:hypothetical protein
MWVTNDGEFLLACVIAMKKFPQRAAKTLTLRRRKTIQKKGNFLNPEGYWLSASELSCCLWVNRKLFSCAHFIQLVFSDESEF